jgi:hypothetical protein
MKDMVAQKAAEQRTSEGAIVRQALDQYLGGRIEEGNAPGNLVRIQPIAGSAFSKYPKTKRKKSSG